MYVYKGKDVQMARKTKEDAEQTRLAILDSALQTFYEKGFSRTTFDEIAKRINLTKGAVYWHFKNKADVIAEIIVQKVTTSQNTNGSSVPQTLSELRQELLKRASYIEKDKDFQRFLFFVIYRMEWTEAIFDNVWCKIGELSEIPDKRLLDSLLQIQQNGEIKKDVDVKVLCTVLSCMWNGCVNRYISGRKKQLNLSDMVLNGFDTIVAGIKLEK